MRFLLLAVLLATHFSCSLAGAGAASSRHAFVVGNNKYVNVEVLQQAGNDARSLSKALKQRGFSVTEAFDVDRRSFNRSLSTFLSKVNPGDVTLFFYAGHGIQLKGENYLLPVDIPLAGPGEEDFFVSESISLSSILERIRQRSPKLNIVVLDACRNNPFSKSGSRGLGSTRGLASVAAPQGTFVMYSADVGELALDRLKDGEKNSVFTRTFLAKIAEPGLDLVSVARSVRSEVRSLAATVNHQQTPAYYDAVIGNFYFTPATPKVVVKAPEPPKPMKPIVPLEAQQELAFWNSIGSDAPISAYQAYLTIYPKGRFVTLAKAFIESAQSKEKNTEVAAVPANPVPKVEPAVETDPVDTKAQPEPSPVSGTFERVQIPVIPHTVLVRRIQTELNRVRCNVGRVDGRGGRRTNAALRLFAKNTNFRLSKDLYTPEVLESLKETGDTVCKNASADSENTGKTKQNLRHRKRKSSVSRSREKRRDTKRRRAVVRRKPKSSRRSRGSSCFKFNGKLVCG